MPEKDNTGMGERIQSMVEDAVASMDFEQLNKNITGSIQSVFEELNIQMPQGTGQKDGRTGSDQICQESSGNGDGTCLYRSGRCIYRNIWPCLHCDVCGSERCSKCRTCYGRAYHFVRYHSTDDCVGGCDGEGYLSWQKGSTVPQIYEADR